MLRRRPVVLRAGRARGAGYLALALCVARERPERRAGTASEVDGSQAAKKEKTRHRVSELLPIARPLSIPSHSRQLNRYTAKAILDQLEEDLDALEKLYEPPGEMNE